MRLRFGPARANRPQCIVFCGTSKRTPGHLCLKAASASVFPVWAEWWAFPSAGQPTTTLHKPPKEAFLAAPGKVR